MGVAINVASFGGNTTLIGNSKKHDEFMVSRHVVAMPAALLITEISYNNNLVPWNNGFDCLLRSLCDCMIKIVFLSIF